MYTYNNIILTLNNNRFYEKLRAMEIHIIHVCMVHFL